MAVVSIHSQRTMLFNELFRSYGEPAFVIHAYDGWYWQSSRTQAPECTIVVRTPKGLRSLLANPTELTLGEAFVNGDLDVEGDIFSVFPIADQLISSTSHQWRSILGKAAQISFEWMHGLGSGWLHSLSRDQKSISYHYDQPFEFFQAWLGETLAYSCAYFRNPTNDLDQAQNDKLELICRKLRLAPGDHLLDIGCGWGSLILHAASRYGVDARGITLSRGQAAMATWRITQAKLNRKCAVDFRDYREMAGPSSRFDKIASIGMFEHVGLKNMRRYFRIAHSLLKPDGLFLHSGIVRSASSVFFQKVSFIDKYVFPNGELITLAKGLELAESVGLEVRDVENLREHYERTLRLWVERLQQNRRAVLQKVSEKIYRIWLLYMAGSAVAFERGKLMAYQVLLARPDNARCHVPHTREDWYRNWERESSRLSA
jgi:cyclopropane-fatty-acyl-phospholipid synthase